jgi:hypothetical protein
MLFFLYEIIKTGHALVVWWVPSEQNLADPLTEVPESFGPLLLLAFPLSRRRSRRTLLGLRGRKGARLVLQPEVRGEVEKLVLIPLVVVKGCWPALCDGDIQQSHSVRRISFCWLRKLFPGGHHMQYCVDIMSLPAVIIAALTIALTYFISNSTETVHKTSEN